MKVWRLLMWFLLWEFYSFFSLPRILLATCGSSWKTEHKRQNHLNTFLLPKIFRTALLFSLVRSLLVKKGRFYGSICWKFTRIYIFVKRRPNKAVSLIMLKCKSAQNHNFYDTSYSLTVSRNIREHSQVIEIWVGYIVVCIWAVFSVILTITTATAIKIAYEVSSRAGTAISFEISFSRNFTEKIFFLFILFVQRIQNSRAKYKQLR